MKTVILTGSPWSDVDALFGALERFGVENAQNDKNATIGRWYDQLFSGELSSQYRQIQLGKAWEQAVSEVFLANWGNKTWGWADSRSTWLLDFWRDYDPQTRFILVQTSPQLALSRAIGQNGERSTFLVDEIVATWIAYERELLRFYLRNQQRCLLVDFEQASHSPALLAEAANDILGLDIKLGAETPDVPVESAGSPATALAALLAQQALEKFPEARILWQEITASLTLLQTDSASTQQESVQIEDAIVDLRELSHTVDTALETLVKVQDEHSALVAENQGRVELLVQANATLAAEKTALEQQFSVQRQKYQALENEMLRLVQERDEYARQVTEHLQQFNSEREQAIQIAEQNRQENELLLLQLHEVQEELEKYFLKARSLESEVNTREDELVHRRNLVNEQIQQINELNSLLVQARDEQARLTEHQQQINSEREHYAQIAEQNRQENELLLLQLHQVQEELEQYFLKAQSLESEVNSREDELVHLRNLVNEQIHQINALNNTQNEQCQTLGNEILLLTQARDEYARQVTECQQRIEQLAQDVQSTLELQAQINRLNNERDHSVAIAAQHQQESELLLLQLHQVQEELERYFLQHQQEQQLRKQSEQRLSRVLSRWPDFVDMAGLQVAYIAKENSQEVILTARDIYHASRFIEQYVLRIRFNGGNPEIVIERSDNQLLRWPVAWADEKAIVIPVISNQLAAAKVHLATSDWQLLQALSQTCAHMLKIGDFQLADENGQFNPAICQQVLIQLAQTIQVYSNSLSYDSVVLKREQVNRDYEHLWLQFSNLFYKDKRWSHAEFRLSAALVNKKSFSIHPKLEFPQPQTGLPLFENWQPDLEDDFGLKMELRFEVKSQAVDVNFWNSLTNADRSLLINLICFLPEFLADLEAQNIAISRAWQDWQNLVLSTIETIHARRVELGLEQPAQPLTLS